MQDSEIIKSFQHFYEDIIPKARCSPNWDEKSIAVAFSWAKFCEQVYDNFSDDNETAQNLDAKIHQLTSSRLGVSYCFKNLKQASLFLCQSLLQNPNIQKDSFQDMIAKIQPLNLDFEKAALEVNELDTLCLELLESLKCITLPDSDQSFYIDIKTELLLDFLKDALVHLSTENQYENQLSFVLNILCKSQENLAFILQILISDADFEIESEIQEFIVNWILLKVLDEKNGPLAHFLWGQPLLKLRKIALKFPSFSSFYIYFLTKCASALSLEYENFVKCWKKRVSMVEITLEYRDILKHFEALLSVEDELSKTIRRHLCSMLVCEDEPSIWWDIFSHFFSKEI